MKVTVLKKGIGGGGRPVGCPWLIDYPQEPSRSAERK